MKEFATEQEDFWAGKFGSNYIERNQGEIFLASKTHLFSKILNRTQSVQSVLEFGSNIGLNLSVIQQLLPKCEVSAIEINQTAVEELKRLAIKHYHQSILEFESDYQRDLCLIQGVLIHMNPDVLQQVYTKLYEVSKRYICVIEYYNPTPVELNYRGHEGRLFKRDFAGEILDKYPDLHLLDYGFCYHRDNNFVGSDQTWFLLEKR
jgi:pseudaminic acid biosynthesis-associated methylase